jgi:hypothetical protein
MRYKEFRDHHLLIMRIWQAAIVLALTAGAMTGGSAAATAAGIMTGTDSGSTNACVDTPLTITFGSVPTLGTTGSITVHNMDGSVADTIDLADPASFTETVGGATDEAGNPHYFNYYPVIILIAAAPPSIRPGRRLKAPIEERGRARPRR